MIYDFILSPDAKEGVRSTLLWYLQHDIDLPFRFAVELKSTLNRIQGNPYQFPRVGYQLRRARMKRFPYLVYFTLIERTAYIIAVSHQRRLNPLSRP